MLITYTMCSADYVIDKHDFVFINNSTWSRLFEHLFRTCITTSHLFVGEFSALVSSWRLVVILRPDRFFRSNCSEIYTRSPELSWGWQGVCRWFSVEKHFPRFCQTGRISKFSKEKLLIYFFSSRSLMIMRMQLTKVWQTILMSILSISRLLIIFTMIMRCFVWTR